MMRLTLPLAAALLAGCSYVPSLYRVPVLQGNVVTTESYKKLELGMTPPQVRYLLGTPLIHSSIAPHRWDYVFYYRDPRGDVRESELSLFFNDGQLARIEGGESYDAVLPEERKEIDANPDVLEGPNA